MRTLTRTIILMGLILITSNLLFGCGMQNSIRSTGLTSLGSSGNFHPGYQPYDSAPGRVKDSIRPEIGLKGMHELTVPNPWINHGWARTWGTSGEQDRQEYARDVSIDRFGNIYVAGNFANSVDFSCGQEPNGYILNSFGQADAFITKFNTSGDFQWARRIGDDEDERALGVATDSEGSVIFTGCFEGEVDFDPHVSHWSNQTSNGGDDIYVSKFDKLGRHIWTRSWGSHWKDERGMAVAVDNNDNVYVTGYFGYSVDFQPGNANETHTSNGNVDVFISKFDSWGVRQWTRTFGGSHGEVGFGIAVDSSGGVYIGGDYGGTDCDFSGGQVNEGVYRNATKGDAFVSKWDSEGNFHWVATFGGQESDACLDVAVDQNDGSVYASGYFRSTCYFVDAQGNQPGGVRGSAGARDGILLKYDTDGNLIWNHTIEGPERDLCVEIAVDGKGDVYTTGFYSETADFAPQNGHDNHTAADLHDGFLTKFTSSGDYLWTRTWGAGMFDECFGVAADPVGGAYVAGVYGLTVNFATVGSDMHSSQGGRDMFLMSFPPSGNWGQKIRIEAVPRLKLIN